jgi:predicted negative regulator of RcsB-dependent stress response
MRDLLAHADLARYAGQFVWLELSYDEVGNRAFMTKYGAEATPTFFVIDPQDERVTAMQPGAMSLQELTQFLDRGKSGAFAKSQSPADAALTRGDALLAQQPADAAKAYEEALHSAPGNWPQRELVEASLVQALQDSSQWQRCAETAATDAARMQRDVIFVRTVVGGMWCLASTDPAPWAEAALGKLKPRAEEALSLPTTVRDHRDATYRTLMYISVARHDNAGAAKWGERWLAELDAIKPSSDDERSALDIARVENIQIFGDPVRILPALIESERVMPNNYIASLRLAQMEIAVKHYDETIAACDRGLARTPGSNGTAWLLQIKARALRQKGQTEEAHRALEQALQAAETIPNQGARDMNIPMITDALKATEKATK